MKKIGIVGFRGYSGAELAQLLSRHGGVEVFRMEHREDPTAVKGQTTMPASAEAVAAAGLDGIFLATHFCEVTENFSAYSLLYHRHVAEVLQNTGLREAEFSFAAQLIPVHRGILETIYFRASDLKSAAEIVGMYETRYADEPFVRIYEPGKVPDLRAVAHTNFCDIGVVFDGRTKRGIVVAAIDNLVKGAAGQAIQNMNLILGFPETQGLL